MLEFILLAEKGMGSLVCTIDDYEVKWLQLIVLCSCAEKALTKKIHIIYLN